MSVTDRVGVSHDVGRAIDSARDRWAAYVERFDHPFLLALLPASALSLVLGAIAEASGWYSGAGFFALFAVKFVLLCLLGYAAFYGLEYAQRGLEYWRVRKRRRA